MPMAMATLPDGASIAYDVHDFTDPWRQPETIILVHGFTKNRKFWYAWIPQLARRYRVICMDQRGHGDSTPLPPDFRMGLAPFAADLAAFIDVLGIQPAFLAMAEFTSAVAIELATTYPEHVRGLVVPGFWSNARASPVNRQEWIRLVEEEGAEAMLRASNNLRLPEGADPRQREWYIRQQARTPAWFMAALFRFNHDLDLTPRLPRIHAPTLLISGTQGQQGTLASAREACGSIPNCRLAVLEGMPFNVMSAAPNACVRETLRFLDDVVNGKPARE